MTHWQLQQVQGVTEANWTGYWTSVAFFWAPVLKAKKALFLQHSYHFSVKLGALLFYPNKWCLCQNINNVICHNLCFSSFFVPSLCQIKIPMDTFVCARHSKGATTNCVLQPLPPWFQKHPGKTLHIECVLRPYVQTPHMKNGSCVCCFLITLMNFCHDQYRNWGLGYKDLRAFSIENSKFYLLCYL